MSVFPIRAAAPEPIMAVLTTRTRPAAWWEQVLVGIWVLCTFIVFPGNAYLLYPSALIFLALFFVYRDVTVPIALRAPLLLVVPVLGVLSTGWSSVPAETFRVGAMMVLNFFIMVTIAARLDRRQIVRAVFFAGIVAIVIAAPLINTFDRGGPYGSKNIFAIRMLICLLAALAIMFESKEHFLVRLLAVPVAGVALVFTLAADSATALVFALVAIIVMTGLWMFWQPVSRIRHLRSFVMLMLMVLFGGGLIAFLAMPNNSLMNDFLAAVGKDATLTNRTIIWEMGNRVAKENPWFGTGLEVFWQRDSGPAQTLNEMDNKAIGTKLSFHNTYIEIKVALGLVGMYALITAITWSYIRTVYNWFRTQGMAASFFLTTATVVLISTFTESYMSGAFDTFVLLFYLGALTGLAEKYHVGQRQYVRLKPEPA